MKLDSKKYKLVFPWTAKDLREFKTKTIVELLAAKIIEVRK